ncbi:DUF3319 domain-containing protein [Vibrio diazotrophicus]|uniref:DUF3319 domain-containing protein n=1 Tax=Vibrio diazotrophicus TaxID=685 RepID=UPI003D2F9288
MDKMKSFLSIFTSAKPKSRKAHTVRTDFYRGHFIKRNADSSERWSVILGEKMAVGEIKYIKMTIDHWADTGTYVPPEYFKSNDDPSNRQTFDYKNFKIINDLGGQNDWYIIYRGKLMKGSKDKIIQVIDRIEERVSVIK